MLILIVKDFIELMSVIFIKSNKNKLIVNYTGEVILGDLVIC